MRAYVLGGEEGVAPDHDGHRGHDEHARGQEDPPGTPALQHDRPPFGSELPELAEHVAGVSFHEGAELRRARHAAGSGERLGELGRGEVAQRPLVDPLRIRAHREHQHHVAQVDRLPPRRGSYLDEEHVDQQQLPVADHEIARLDVPVRDPRVPHGADKLQPLVDHAVVDVGFADLHGAMEELGDQHVLALWRDLHDAVRPGGRHAHVLQQAKGVVLVLGEPPHRLERMLVFQGAVEDGPPELVPAVGAHVALGVELGEQVLVRVSLDLQPQRCRAC